jgi:Polyketide cyclase / dehydrase and lipid transport
MLKKILIVVALVIVVFVIVVATRPANYTVTRSATMTASTEAVFAQVNDLHKWEAWSPWAKLDPAMKETFEGTEAGVGASYSWAGNKQVGEGRMTITQSRANELVGMRLEFLKPMASTCSTVFSFKSAGDQTAVTWTMSGTNNFVGKAFCMFMNMDKMVGGDFEKGLTKMKTVVETAAKK